MYQYECSYHDLIANNRVFFFQYKALERKVMGTKGGFFGETVDVKGKV